MPTQIIDHMSMIEKLDYFIRLNVKNPKWDEIPAILELFHERHYAKGEPFKSDSDVCNELGFITEGSTGHSVIKKNGDKITARVTSKNNFVTDLISARTKSLTPINIVALEPTSMLVASTDDVADLFEVNLTFNRMMRENLADSVVELARIHMLFLTGTAKERYQFIIDRNPSLLQHVPLRIIASMIGVTPTQLSRIRKDA